MVYCTLVLYIIKTNYIWCPNLSLRILCSKQYSCISIMYRLTLSVFKRALPLTAAPKSHKQAFDWSVLAFDFLRNWMAQSVFYATGHGIRDYEGRRGYSRAENAGIVINHESLSKPEIGSSVQTKLKIKQFISSNINPMCSFRSITPLLSPFRGAFSTLLIIFNAFQLGSQVRIIHKINIFSNFV